MGVGAVGRAADGTGLAPARVGGGGTGFEAPLFTFTAGLVDGFGAGLAEDLGAGLAAAPRAGAGLAFGFGLAAAFGATFATTFFATAFTRAAARTGFFGAVFAPLAATFFPCTLAIQSSSGEK